jgi:O-antigen/teichoic acid export membrane protein
MKDRIAKSIFWLVWSRGVIQLASFAVTLAVARLLTPSDYGLMAIASVWTGVLVLICELGLGAIIVQFRDLEQDELNLCFLLNMALASLFYLSLFAAASSIADWFASPPLDRVLQVAGVVLLLEAIQIVPDGLLRKRMQFDKLSQAEIAAAIIGIPVVFVMAWTGAGVWALVAGVLVRSFVRGALAFWFVGWWPGISFRGNRLREILKFSLGTFGSRALWSLYDQSDSFVLGKIAGSMELGFYSMARDLANLPMTKITAVVNQLAVPLMAELQHDGQAMHRTLGRGIRLVGAVSIPLCVGLGIMARDLVVVALTEKWLPIVPMLQILCFCSLVKCLDNLLPPVLTARYRTTFLAFYNLLLLLVMPLAFLLAAKWAGGVGVAVAWAVVYPIIMLWMAREVFRELKMNWEVFWEQIRMPVRASALMILVILVVQGMLPGHDLFQMWTRLLAASGTGLLAYTTVLWFWGGKTAPELLEVVQWVLRPRKSVAPQA